MRPLVTIVIPAYNGAEQLRRAIPMLDRQGYAPLEAVVVDDGSADHTRQVLEELCRERPWLRWVHQANAGAGAARNRGVAEARGAFIAFLDCDDLWPANALEARMAPFLGPDDPELLGVYCPAELVDEAGDKLVDGPLFDYAQPFERLYFSAVMGSLFNPSCVILRKSAFDRVGGFRGELSPAEDFDLWQRMLRTGGCFLKAPDCRIGWVQHPSSSVHTMLGRHHAQCARVMEQLYAGTEEGPWLPEFSGPFGAILARKERTGWALGTALMAAAAGDLDTARSVAENVSLPFLKQIPVARLLWMVRFNTLRALCRKESDWLTSVWPEAAPRILAFLRGLEERLGATRTLPALIAELEQLPGREG